jgi:hypothetical protein
MDLPGIEIDIGVQLLESSILLGQQAAQERTEPVVRLLD